MRAESQPTLRSQKHSPVIIAVLFLLFASGIYICSHETSTRAYSIYKRTWGFDNILFYGQSATYLYLFLALALLFPYSNGFIYRGASWFSEKIGLFAGKKILLFILVSLAAGVIFYLLRVKYYFLGDFNLRLIQTMKKEFVSTEYLTMRLLYVLGTLGAKFNISADQVFKIYSCVMGAFYVFTSCLSADILGKTKVQKLILFASMIGTAMMLVFCGYVEIYATPIFMLSCYIYTAFAYLHKRLPFYIPLLVLLLTCGSHLLSVAAIPSYFVLLYFRNKEKFSTVASFKNRSIFIAITLLVIAGIFVAFRMKSGFLHVISAPIDKPKIMTFLSFSHIWEVFNGQLLCCGFFFIFLFILLIKAAVEGIRLDGIHYFLIALGGCLLLTVVLANLQRGSGDWDIMSFTAVALNLLCVLLIYKCFKDRLPVRNYLLVALTGLNSMSAFMWIHINHTDRSIAKIEKMLISDPGTYYSARISGPLQLALTFKNNKLYKDSERMALYACDHAVKDDYKGCVMYGQRLKESNRTEEAKDFFVDLIEHRTPYVYESYLYVLEYYENHNSPEKVKYFLDKLMDSFLANADVFLNNNNFKKPVLIGLFQVLYKIEDPKNIKRRELIQKLVKALEELQIPPRQKI